MNNRRLRKDPGGPGELGPLLKTDGLILVTASADNLLLVARNLLDPLAEASAAPGEKGAQRALKATASAVTRALGQPDHPFTLIVKQIEWAVPQPDATGKLPTLEPWYYDLLWPMPGSGCSRRRGLWKISLLLLVACLYPAGRKALAEAVAIPTVPPEQLRPKQVEAAVRQFVPRVFQDLSGSLFPRLNEALAYLEGLAVPPPQLIIENRVARMGDVRVKLSQQQAVYLAELIQHAPQPVSYSRLLELGIKSPRDLKHRLLKKLSSKGIQLQILTPMGKKTDILRKIAFSTPKNAKTSNSRNSYC